MDVSFCDKCDNLLYLYLDSETNTMIQLCKSCGNRSPVKNQIISVTNDTVFNVDKSDVINTNPYICHDITLPTIENNPNIQCKNKECPGKQSKIKYIKYDDIAMKYMYICQHCGTSWKLGDS